MTESTSVAYLYVEAYSVHFPLLADLAATSDRQKSQEKEATLSKYFVVAGACVRSDGAQEVVTSRTLLSLIIARATTKHQRKFIQGCISCDEDAETSSIQLIKGLVNRGRWRATFGRARISKYGLEEE